MRNLICGLHFRRCETAAQPGLDQPVERDAEQNSPRWCEQARRAVLRTPIVARQPFEHRRSGTVAANNKVLPRQRRACRLCSPDEGNIKELTQSLLQPFQGEAPRWVRLSGESFGDLPKPMAGKSEDGAEL